MADKKLTYKELQQERDAYKAENDALKRDRVNRQAKNSVFLNLFMRKEYQVNYPPLSPRAEVEACAVFARALVD
ncbi:MAG: hypothetical protein IJ088_06325 [Clostridia bacterium]|nr:hypothetical protein [Clostridia bacterium]